MNTIPTTFKRPRVPYTVVGGTKKDRIRRYSSRLTILILGRGGRFYRGSLLEEILELGIGDILYVEGPNVPYDVEPLFRKYPEVRFLLLRADSSTGEKLNLGIEEARARLVMVLWSDMRPPAGLSAKLLDKIDESAALCTSPQLRNPKNELIPSIQVPAFIKRNLKVVPWRSPRDALPTIFPFDYCGVYNKEKFLFTGGFDYTIANPYWQKLDFGFRAFMWGEKILATTSLAFDYSLEVPSEDSTPDESYKFFYLKNLAVRYRRDMGVLPTARFFTYLVRADKGPLYSLREFLQVKKWVEINRYRFTRDATRLVEQWEMPE